jgi:hypothetical protein
MTTRRHLCDYLSNGQRFLETSERVKRENEHVLKIERGPEWDWREGVYLQAMSQIAVLHRCVFSSSFRLFQSLVHPVVKYQCADGP